MKRVIGIVALAAIVLPAMARAQVLNFEGIGNWQYIGDYYNGGGGPNYGIHFSPYAETICLNTLTVFCSNTSRGGQGDPSSQYTAMFWLSGGSDYMEKASGFTSGFSFFYTAPYYGGSFSVYSGLGGTGTLLASVALGLTPNGQSGLCPGYDAAYCPFVPVGVSFSGTAQSVVFSGTPNYIVFDDVTFGSSTPGNITPEPASIALLATGLFGIGGIGVARRRRNG